MVARKLLARGHQDLKTAVHEITTQLAKQPTAKDRLRYLLEEWKFRLPMASSILAVLYPDDFTVYDVRVCDELGAFRNLGNRTRFESLWAEYEDFKRRVQESTPKGLPLRESDRYLWGRSFYKQLRADVANRFKRHGRKV